MVLIACLCFARQSAPDLVIVNGRIWTDGHLSRNSSIAVKDGRFIAVGTDLSGKIGPGTKVIDAKGNWIVPGLIDCHTHMLESSTDFAFGLDLRPAKNKSEFIKLVADKVKQLGPNEWVLGGSWTVDSYPNKDSFGKAWIDGVTRDHPALLSRMDGHSILVNSKAFELSHITKDGPSDPPGGRIERDPITHEPTGVLSDTALSLIHKPLPNFQQMERALPYCIDEAHRWGVTASGEIVQPILSGLWPKYMKSPGRSYRVAMYMRADSPQSADIVANMPSVEGWFEPKGVKLFMDGSLGSRSGYMAKPYTKPLPTQPKDWRGSPRPGATNGLYKSIIAEAAKVGIQVVTHAIGDQANHDILDLYSAVPDVQNRRFRIEHAQHLLPEDIRRFHDLGVIASMQPYHKADDARYCEDVIGVARSRTSYAFHDIESTGGRLGFGSDFPVVTLNPWVGIATAVTGRVSTGKVWMPHQNISLDKALEAYTSGAAYACRMESEIGRIAEGYHADFVILDRRLNRDGSNVAGTKPLLVFEEGKDVTVGK